MLFFPCTISQRGIFHSNTFSLHIMSRVWLWCIIFAIMKITILLHYLFIWFKNYLSASFTRPLYIFVNPQLRKDQFRKYKYLSSVQDQSYRYRLIVIFAVTFRSSLQYSLVFAILITIAYKHQSINLGFEFDRVGLHYVLFHFLNYFQVECKWFFFLTAVMIWFLEEISGSKMARIAVSQSEIYHEGLDQFLLSWHEHYRKKHRFTIFHQAQKSIVQNDTFDKWRQQQTKRIKYHHIFPFFQICGDFVGSDIFIGYFDIHMAHSPLTVIAERCHWFYTSQSWMPQQWPLVADNFLDGGTKRMNSQRIIISRR